ncbi:thioredoxin [Persicobacter diffluens]|uniref:thioredoxin n=1 Tax=Persicobacter diffluens TaxID=981 RepID=UPI003B97D599
MKMSKFKELINGDQPVLVDFYADWCGPCKAQTPILSEVAKAVEGKAKIIKIDVDKNQAAAAQYGVQSIPTLLLFKNGEVVWRNVGVAQKPQLLQAITSNV